MDQERITLDNARRWLGLVWPNPLLLAPDTGIEQRPPIQALTAPMHRGWRGRVGVQSGVHGSFLQRHRLSGT